MKVHEYQAKQLFAQYDIPVDRCLLAHSVDEAVAAYTTLGEQRVVVKAQVHTGGRGKAGGVKVASSADEVLAAAQAILGMTIRGFVVDRVLVSVATTITAEYYVSLLIDRTTKAPLLMLCRDGGMDIEEVAKVTPERIVKIPIDPLVGMTTYKARAAAMALFTDKALVQQALPLFKNLYRLFLATDASLAEINPLVVDDSGQLRAIDAKMTFDDNALFRQQAIEALREPTEEEQKELYAKERGFSYVSLGGDIGCMVNGAGLAMATMDMIHLYGGAPANFLDIGGSSNPQKIVEAMRLLLADGKVRVVLINIFGGITRCDDVARGLVEALQTLHPSVPIVIRLTGTNETEGRALLADIPCTVATSLAAAGHHAVALARP